MGTQTWGLPDLCATAVGLGAPALLLYGNAVHRTLVATAAAASAFAGAQTLAYAALPVSDGFYLQWRDRMNLEHHKTS